MECTSCGGVLVEGKTIQKFSRKNFNFILENIPAFKCTRCDAVLVEDDVSMKIKKLINKIEKESNEIASGIPSANLYDY
jgi:YgiT-type zinc finger domain-containing protein